ncbi:Aspartate-semialdehyde dehydrogenase [Marinobacterium lacunae]|uniref:Aspartate-semialdehyde dehydrogenase n=1 Tax=Marinobacterium lacunae TaxID=1232683 RepID=A0A081FZ71_9GAMM|nr:Asd/ArgC dimerization domain-containing protein [Marinobacterium lacunae]KEA63826.1 Aspartate-semialdehyde dehydrogenase [Marinobacterium lacunae]
MNVAIFGPSTLTGENLFELLDGHDLKVDRLSLYDREDEAGRALMFRGSSTRVRPQETAELGSDLDLVFLCDAEMDKDQLERINNCGALVIDLFPARQSEPVLIVPEVNGDKLATVKRGDVVGCPDASSIAAAMALAPMQKEYQLLRLNVVALQSAAALGHQGVEALASETARLLNGRDAEASLFDSQYAFNLIPQVGKTDAQGFTVLEHRFVSEVKELLNDDEMEIVVNVLQLPIFYGVAVMMQAETAHPVDLAAASSALEKFSGIELNRGNKPVTPVGTAAGHDQVYVDRLRLEPGVENAFGMCAVTDNLRKGGALNAIQIAQSWQKQVG